MNKTKFIHPDIDILKFDSETVETELSNTKVQGSYAAGALADYAADNEDIDLQQITTIINVFELKY